MTVKILMPALSPTMTEGIVSKWLVKIGDYVKAGDILAEIETDKATMEVEAVDEGTVTHILVQEGENSIQVNSPIAILDGSDEDIEEYKNKKEKKKPNISNKKELNIINDGLDTSSSQVKEEVNINSDSKKILASPYVISVSRKKNIDLTKLKGSGPRGRIIKKDLEKFELAFPEISNSTLSDNNIIIEPSSIRKIIALRTTQTKQNVPHFYLKIESQVDKLFELRKIINQQDKKNNISINDLLVKALAIAQSKNPLSNVSWSNEKIIKYNTVDVSIAVALEEGLITPIVKNADKKGLIEISREIKELVVKAKKGKLNPSEYNGGTISISNLGMFGITEFSAIINPPQASILAVGKASKKLGKLNDEIIEMSIIKSTLSADHRVLDGAVAAKLLKDFNEIVENPFDLWLQSKDMEII